mgnify:CR=1 FL=1
MGNTNWETPAHFFDRCQEAFGPFFLDAAADRLNTKCADYIDAGSDALSNEWFSSPVWLNPPYVNLIKWVEKAIEESDKGLLVCMLLPNDTDTVWFHLLMERAEIYLTRGRVKFIDPESKGRNSPRQGHIVAVLRPPVEGVIRPAGIVGTIDAN